MSNKPSIPKGTRDFIPLEKERRNYIFSTITKTFKRYGFAPIETPAMEKLSTLLGKYGEDGDKLLFRILNSGNYLSGIENSTLATKNINELTSKISGKGLRYDLTVPFARFVVQHRNEISFPFKRYQIQPVWRADRPQKGRYREFYQCDADIIGTNSLLCETDLIQLINEVFYALKIDITIRLNNRKILLGIAEAFKQQDKLKMLTIALDKLDKAGIEVVIDELKEKGISASLIDFLMHTLKLSAEEQLQHLEKLFADDGHHSETGLKGINEINYIQEKVRSLNVENTCFDLTLARGLDYYTGAIIEVVTNDFPSSICGGGRYDDLTGIFGLKDVSGVGISFGAERIYDIMLQNEMFPEGLTSSVEVMFVNFGEDETNFCLPILKKLREEGISAELYPDPIKINKQLNYANNKNISYVILVGENEMKNNVVTVKNMDAGEQKQVGINELLKGISKNLFRDENERKK